MKDDWSKLRVIKKKNPVGKEAKGSGQMNRLKTRVVNSRRLRGWIGCSFVLGWPDKPWAKVIKKLKAFLSSRSQHEIEQKSIELPENHILYFCCSLESATPPWFFLIPLQVYTSQDKTYHAVPHQFQVHDGGIVQLKETGVIFQLDNSLLNILFPYCFTSHRLTQT